MDGSNPPRAQDIHRVLQLLLYAQRGVTLEADRLLAQHGYDRAHFRILYIIGQLPGTNLKDLVDGIGASHQAVSQLLKRLIDDGQIRQEQDDRDKRKRRLFLTQAGDALRQGVFDRQAEVIGRALRVVGEDGVVLVLQAMDAMVSARDRPIVDKLDGSITGKRLPTEEEIWAT